MYIYFYQISYIICHYYLSQNCICAYFFFYQILRFYLSKMWVFLLLSNVIFLLSQNVFVRNSSSIKYYISICPKIDLCVFLLLSNITFLFVKILARYALSSSLWGASTSATPLPKVSTASPLSSAHSMRFAAYLEQLKKSNFCKVKCS